MFENFGAQLELYREQVLKAAKEKNGEPVYNGSLEHAAVLAENLFRFADNDVKIFSGSLNPRVFGGRRTLDRAAQFLGKSSRKVKVIVEDHEAIDWEDHPLIVHIKSDDLEFRKLSPDLSSQINYHFMVADSESYRFEKDKCKPSAIAAFGDKEGGEKLNEIFDSLWVHSEPLNALPTS